MIGYYVHHVGRGHLHRARAVAAHLDEPVAVLTSLPRPERYEPFTEWVGLPPDDADPAAAAHDADGALHWAPVDAPGYSARMHRVAHWLATTRPRVLVVDTSVEIAALARLLGVRVVAVAGVGRRHDPAHTLLYRCAELIVGPWPGGLYEPAHLAPFAHKTATVGALSRFDGRPVEPVGGHRRVLVLAGGGGVAFTCADVAAAAAATPDWTWTAVGLPGSAWCPDVWAALTAADVVVSAAGMNSLAEIAAARRPAVVLPQERPHDEQRTTGRVLRDHGLAVVADTWPAACRWPDVLAEAQRIGGAGWSAWSTGSGARDAARLISGVGRAAG